MCCNSWVVPGNGCRSKLECSMNTIHRRPCLVFLYLGLGCERMFLKRQIFLETAHIIYLDFRKQQKFGTGGYFTGINTWARLNFRGNVQCGLKQLPPRHPVTQSGLEDISCVSVNRTPRWETYQSSPHVFLPSMSKRCHRPTKLL